MKSNKTHGTSFSYDEIPRNSLLDVVMSEYDKQQDPKIYARLLYVSQKVLPKQSGSGTGNNNSVNSPPILSSSYGSVGAALDGNNYSSLSVGTSSGYHNSNSVKQYHVQLFEESGHKEEDFFGLLYESDQYVVHILESTTQNVKDFMRALNKDQQALEEFLRVNHQDEEEENKCSIMSHGDYLNQIRNQRIARILNVKILLFTEDFGKGVSFPIWSCRELPSVKLMSNQDASSDEDDDDEGDEVSGEEDAVVDTTKNSKRNQLTRQRSKNDVSQKDQLSTKNIDSISGVSWIVRIHRLLNQLLFVAEEIKLLGTIQITLFFESMLQKHSGMIPSESSIELLVSQCQDSFTIQEFMYLFDSSVQVTLESELVWPYPVPLYLDVSEIWGQ